jgi:hypothetical protein
MARSLHSYGKCSWQAVADEHDRQEERLWSNQMCFRIERLVGGEDIVVFNVSGRMQAEHLDTLRELLGREEGKVVVDLKEVTLVDREAVSFLASGEANGVELRNCAAYIREWVARERSRRDRDRADPGTGVGDDIGDI